MNNIIKNLQARLEARKVEGEQGSLLLDVLIGMAIFALIALIAVSAVNGYRQRAYETATTSDVGGLALEIEANFTDAQTYPTAVTLTAGEYTSTTGVAPAPVTTAKFDQKVSKNVSVGTYKDRGDGTFCITTVHKTGTTVDAWSMFDSKTGLKQNERGAAAATAAADATKCA